MGLVFRPRSTLKSTIVQQPTFRGWHRVSRKEEEGKEKKDGRAEGSSVTEDGRQDAISLMLDIHGTHIHIFEISQL